MSYVLDNVPARPVTFAFNGGPGASAAFLHMGAMGPRIRHVHGKWRGAHAPRCNTSVNADSWLAFTDLVFVDPVGTGYSRAATGGEDAGARLLGCRQGCGFHYGIREDLYLARNEREDLPRSIWPGKAMADFAPHFFLTGSWQRGSR